MKIRLAVFR